MCAVIMMKAYVPLVFFFFLFEENKYLHGCLAHVCANTEQTSQLAVKTDTYTTS